MLRFLLIALFFFVAGKNFADLPECKEIQDFIFENLEQSGTLEQNEEGFVYLKVDDDYINKLLPFIEEQGFVTPPYFGSPELCGAHITVISVKENEAFKVGRLRESELGRTIYFRIKECQIVNPPNWEGVDEVYLITLEAPMLFKIRQRYLPPRPKFPYHITIGIKRTPVAPEEPAEQIETEEPVEHVQPAEAA